MSRRHPGCSCLVHSRPITLFPLPTMSYRPRVASIATCRTYSHSLLRPKRVRSTQNGASGVRCSGGRIGGRRLYNQESRPPPTSSIARTQLNAVPEKPSVAIIGGGLTGLTAAYHLASKCEPGTRIVLYEAADRVGGWIRTETAEVTVGGETRTVTYERGPRSLSPGDALHGKQDRLVLWDLSLSTGLRPIAPDSKSMPRYIYYNGRVTALPPHNPIWNFWREPLLRDLLPGAFFWYLRMATRGDKAAFPTRDDVSVADYIRAASKSDTLVDIASAGIHGIWGGDVERLGAASVLGWLFHSAAMSRGRSEVVHKRLSEELWRQRFLAAHSHVESYEHIKPQLMNFGRHGMEALPAALHDMLKSADEVDIRLKTPVKQISYLADQNKVQVDTHDGKTEVHDKVISTLTAKHLARLVPQDQLSSLRAFHSVSIMAVNIWYPQPGLVPPGLGYLIPRSCPRELNPERALGVFFDSNLLEEQTAREGGTKVYVLLGGHYYDGDGNGDGAAPIPDEQQAVEQAKALLWRHLGIPPDTPCDARAELKRDCLPQHFVGHHRRVTEAHRQIAANFGGTLAAVGGSFDRPGVMGALRSGYDIANNMLVEDWKTTGMESLTEERVFDPLYPLKGPNALSEYVSIVGPWGQPK